MRTGQTPTRSWLPSRRLLRRSRGVVLGGLWLRCVTRLARRELDRQLARGVDPMESDELSLRVGQLGSAGTRARLACDLVNDGTGPLYRAGGEDLGDAVRSARLALMASADSGRDQATTTMSAAQLASPRAWDRTG